MRVEPGRSTEAWNLGPSLAPDDAFSFVCAGCGDCCRHRHDLVLSGYDLFRIARRLRLSPRIVAHAFCKEYIAPQSCLPALCLTPDPKTGHCRFFEGNACTIHEARPLACALYPLGQTIDPITARMEYHAQLPLCGVCVQGRTLRQYLEDSAVEQRAGTDARWAVVCTQISEQMLAAGGQQHPHFAAAARRIQKALYLEYDLGDEFYPQFQQNITELMPLLSRILSSSTTEVTAP